jgi:hypothetical protein
MILDDEDISSAIQMHLQAVPKCGYIRAQDVVDFIASPEMQAKMGAANI